eukprot:COSAG01_NODE_12_length_41732_cov_160.472964_37_plen_77_part_00
MAAGQRPRSEAEVRSAAVVCDTAVAVAKAFSRGASCSPRLAALSLSVRDCTVLLLQPIRTINTQYVEYEWIRWIGP